MKKILSVVGARPQFIKLSPLSRVLNGEFEEIVLHTGQHYDDKMSDVFFKELRIPEPKYNLGIGSGKHGAQTAMMLSKMEEVFEIEKPDLVIVFGDTNSTLAGVLASSKLRLNTLHIEAGLRSFNRNMPEEINRVVSDHLCNFLFAPTEIAMDNLERENLISKSFLTGDIMVDSVLQNVQIAEKSSSILIDLSVSEKDYYLSTLHRPYNVDEPLTLQNLFSELNKLDKRVIFPVHPRTKSVITENNIYVGENLRLIEPLGYLDFLKLQRNSLKIITDSGGIQKEAYILKIPCITLRSETEWVETVESGWNLLIKDSIKGNFSDSILNHQPPELHSNIYGKDVSKKMVDLITQLI